VLDAILHHRGALAYSKTDLPALQETARQLQGYAKAERHTLGRMLHDGPMQSLALALVKLSTLPAEDIADATQALLQEALGALQLLENELYSPAVDLLSLGGALRQRWRALPRTPLALRLSTAEEDALGDFDKDRSFPLFFLADTLGQLAAQLPEGALTGELCLAKKGSAALLHCSFSGAGTPPMLLNLPPVQTALARLVLVGGRFKLSPKRFTALLIP
jgi:hypothetical protein